MQDVVRAVRVDEEDFRGLGCCIIAGKDAVDGRLGYRIERGVLGGQQHRNFEGLRFGNGRRRLLRHQRINRGLCGNGAGKKRECRGAQGKKRVEGTGHNAVRK